MCNVVTKITATNTIRLSADLFLVNLPEGISGERTESTARMSPPTDAEDTLAELVDETNGFTFDLYQELLADSPDENLFSSTVSVSIALAMTYAGARGETRDQMRDVLRYTLDNELHEGFVRLQQALDERGDEDTDERDRFSEDGETPFELSIVNSLWGQDGVPFDEEYRETVDSYGSFADVDFRTDAEAARTQINQWIADATEGRIENLLAEGTVDERTVLVLVNAVYFLANWAHQFEQGMTREQPFTALDGTTHEVPMMSQQHSFPYAEVDGTQAVELPCVGGDVSMLVVLPPEDEFESYEQSVDSATVVELVDTLEKQEGRVSLPRFEFESGFGLGSVLEQMGMRDAFDAQDADFGAMVSKDESDEDLYLDDVYHKSFVAVDEAGTEAAAATTAMMGTTSVPKDPFEFVADRPFLFAIRDRPTGTVLFLGRAVDPAGWE